MALFESYERRIDQINAVLNSYGIASIEEAERLQRMQDWMYMLRSRASSRSVLRMLAGLTLLVQQSQSRRAAVRLLMQQLLSVRVFSPSVSRVLLQIPVR